MRRLILASLVGALLATTPFMAAGNDPKLIEPEWIVSYFPGEGDQLTVALERNGFTAFIERGDILMNALQVEGEETKKPLNHEVQQLDLGEDRVTIVLRPKTVVGTMQPPQAQAPATLP